MLRLLVASVGPKDKDMRAPMLALAGTLALAAPALAQAVIDVQNPKAAEPPVLDQQQVQPEVQQPVQPQVQPLVAPQVTPQVEPQVQTQQVEPQVEQQQIQERVQQQPAPGIEAPAQSKADATELTQGGRFTLNRVDNGFLRLDTQNGQVAYCRTRTVGWTCQAVPEDRSEPDADVVRLQTEVAALKTLKSDIARLQDEIAALRREVAALKDPPPPRPPADLTPDKGDVIIKLPTHEDVARAREFIAKTWHRLVDMITAVQKDMMQKG
jgi:hypothetical protein